jgi:deoxyguanosine kinase
MDYNYIAVEGNIGSGKTTLAHKLASDFNAELVLEQFADNEFLPKFYAEPRRYAFTLEMSFLAERYSQLSGLGSDRNLFSSVRISDYMLSKSLIFAASNLNEDELRLFRKVFDIMFKRCQLPIFWSISIQILSGFFKTSGFAEGGMNRALKRST